MYRTAIALAASTMLATAASAQTAPAAPPATAPAAGQAPTAGAAPTTGAAPAAGATVYDAQGGVVGTIASITGANAVIDTGTVKAAVPVASLGTGPKGPTLGLNKVQLEAAAGQQAGGAADFKAKLVAGAQVVGTGGAPVGTIKAVDAQFVTLTTPQGDAKLPIGGFGPSPTGGVAIGMTAPQLAAAISGAKGATGATAPATTAPAGTPPK